MGHDLATEQQEQCELFYFDLAETYCPIVVQLLSCIRLPETP